MILYFCLFFSGKCTETICFENDSGKKWKSCSVIIFLVFLFDASYSYFNVSLVIKNYTQSQPVSRVNPGE